MEQEENCIEFKGLAEEMLKDRKKKIKDRHYNERQKKAQRQEKNWDGYYANAFHCSIFFIFFF